MPINPGPNPPVEKIGVNAVLRRNPESMEKHTTTIFAEFSLWNKTAVLTGGNRGLGLEMALAFVEAGANVYVIDLSSEPSEEFRIVADHCHKLDRQIEYISADVTNEKEMNEAMQLIRQHTGTGSLDICVANAGIMQTYPALDYPIDKFRRMLDVNTIGAFITAQAAARVMSRATEGRSGSILPACRVPWSTATSSGLPTIPRSLLCCSSAATLLLSSALTASVLTLFLLATFARTLSMTSLLPTLVCSSVGATPTRLAALVFPTSFVVLLSGLLAARRRSAMVLTLSLAVATLSGKLHVNRGQTLHYSVSWRVSLKCQAWIACSNS